MSILIEINETLQKGRSKVVCELVQTALEEKYAPTEVLQSLLDGMNVIGEKFKNNEVFVPEVLVSARAMNKGLGIMMAKKRERYLQDPKPFALLVATLLYFRINATTMWILMNSAVWSLGGVETL